MPLLDAFEGALDTAATDQVQRPQARRAEAPRFSTWGMITAAPKGIAAGAAEGIGSTADVLGAFGQALATTEPSAGGMFSVQSDAERKQSQAAAEKVRTQGLDYRSEAGGLFRGVAKDYIPDAATSHAAEVAVGELFRVGSKALTAAAIMGPVPGAIASGLEEGFTTSDKLAQQGVDLETRSSVGAVTAAIQALTFSLPVAGKTMPQTIALALGGGPTAFVVQQAATREILRSQDYSLLADQYDPFDPVGLTLSTVIPLGFGALAMRAGRAAKGAEPLPAAPPVEAIDAARTALLSENLTTSRPVPAEDLQGTAQHQQAYERALDQLASGGRVDVSDAAPLAGADRITQEMQTRLAAVAKELPEREPAQTVPDLPPAETVAAAGETKPAESETPAGKPGAEGGLPVEDAALDARAAQIEQASPDLMVQLEGMDKPEPVGQLMARLRQEVADDLAEAPLIRTAAECFLATL